jgi:hypothetical protein
VCGANGLEGGAFQGEESNFEDAELAYLEECIADNGLTAENDPSGQKTQIYSLKSTSNFCLRVVVGGAGEGEGELFWGKETCRELR